MHKCLTRPTQARHICAHTYVFLHTQVPLAYTVTHTDIDIDIDTDIDTVTHVTWTHMSHGHTCHMDTHVTWVVHQQKQDTHVSHIDTHVSHSTNTYVHTRLVYAYMHICTYVSICDT